MFRFKCLFYHHSPLHPLPRVSAPLPPDEAPTPAPTTKGPHHHIDHLGPVHSKHQCQHCDNPVMTLATLISFKTMQSLQNWSQRAPRVLTPTLIPTFQGSHPRIRQPRLLTPGGMSSSRSRNGLYSFHCLVQELTFISF